MRLIHLTLLLVISSCGPTIKNFDDYQKQFLSKTAFMPTKETLDGKPVKIVVFALDENNLGEIKLPKLIKYNHS